MLCRRFRLAVGLASLLGMALAGCSHNGGDGGQGGSAGGVPAGGTVGGDSSSSGGGGVSAAGGSAKAGSGAGGVGGGSAKAGSGAGGVGPAGGTSNPASGTGGGPGRDGGIDAPALTDAKVNGADIAARLDGTSTETAGAPAECPAPPAGAPADAIIALNAENTARVAMGIPCASLVLTLCTSALNHCNYYTTNQGSSTCQAASAHNEVSGCPNFTGADPGARVRAAGYTGNGWSECMAFRGDPAGAVKTFIDSVYHRTPILSPWYRDMGYGGGVGCDTIDFGPGASTPKTVTAHYPYDGQIEVPLSFNGAQEGPTPPAPATGWPSGYPVTLYGQGITVSSHQIMVDGTTAPLAHQWLDGDSSLGSTAKVLYTDAPLTANTAYRVIIEGTTSSASVKFEWTFTTGAASTGGGGRRRG